MVLEKLKALLGKNDLILVYSGKYDWDNEVLPFIPDIYYLYLLENSIENSYLVIYPEKNKFILYYSQIDPIFQENFRRISLQTIEQRSIQYLFQDLLSNKTKNIYSNSIMRTSNLYEELEKYFKINLEDLEKIMNVNRKIKTEKEIQYIQNSSEASSIIFQNILKQAKTYKNEREIVLYFENELKKLYHLDTLLEPTFAYLPICSNGRNNSILHYNYNRKSIKQENLILLDAGCKYNGYCSDITRTFPSFGKFTQIQKDIYKIVEECFDYSMKHIFIGVDYRQLENEIRIIMYNRLLEIGLCKKQISNKEKLSITKLFMPHLLGHSIGLETHDKPDYLDILEESMTITIEPGIYFNLQLLDSPFINTKQLEKYKDIGGIRIEDTLVVTSNGAKTLCNIPYKLEEIEEFMNK